MKWPLPILQLVPDNTKFDFVRYRFVAFAVSILMTLAALGIFFVNGLNYSIDFTGGTIIEIALDEEPDLSTLREQLNNLNIGSVSIQEFGDSKTLMIRLGQQPGDELAQKKTIDMVRTQLDTLYGEQIDYRRVEYVGPQVGDELKMMALMAFGFSTLGILVYISFRFEWRFGVAAIFTLIHDTIATIGLFALTGLHFDLATLAAILMVIGYSLNDTIVIFDRIRENLRKYKKMPIRDLLNLSTNQTLARSLMTSATTMLVLIALLVFGGEVIRNFTYALIFGVIVGTFSSIYVGGPALMYMNIRRDERPDEAE